MTGMFWSGFLACLRGVLSPEAGGVLPAELSEDLFSTEQRRLRSPGVLMVGGEAGAGSGLDSWRAGSGFDSWRTDSAFLDWASLSFCDSDVLAGDPSESCIVRDVLS